MKISQLFTIKYHNYLQVGLSSTKVVTDATKEGRDGLLACIQVKHQVVETNLKLLVHLLPTLGRADPTLLLEQDTINGGSLSLQALNQLPDSGVGVAHQTEELDIPALTDVVGSGLVVEGGLMHVPSLWLEH